MWDESIREHNLLDYKPSPIDTLRLTLTPEIAQLSEMLARNAHENWANLRIAQGWHYGPRRDDQQKEHPDLVPYEQLPESERQYDRQTAMESIKALLAMGYTIQAPAGTRISVGRDFSWFRKRVHQRIATTERWLTTRSRSAARALACA